MSLDAEQIEHLLERACSGDQDGAVEFLRLFLASGSTVPERTQPNTPSNQAAYPNDFINILALQDGDRVIVPAFTSRERMTEWSEEITAARVISGAHLLQLVPDSWWISFNPGQEFVKEFSPWEISKLREGEEGLKEVIADLFPGEERPPLRLDPVSSPNEAALGEGLVSLAESLPEVERLYIARQVADEESESPESRILIGGVLHTTSDERHEEVARLLENEAHRLSIGGEELRFLWARHSDAIALAVLGKLDPVYIQPRLEGAISSTLRKLKDRFFFR